MGRRTTSSYRIGAGMVAALALVLAACGGSGGGADDGSTSGTGEAPIGGGGTTLVTDMEAGEPANWDYTQIDSGPPQVLLMYNILEPLLEKMEDGSLEPLLAESYEVSDDGLEYVFTIREASFHDGSEVTADDVVYSLELNRQAPAGTISTPFEQVEEIEVVDKRTVRVALSQPSQRFIDAMSRDSGFVTPEGSADELGQRPIGTGPYVFDEWRHGVDLTLTRFEDYWGELPYFERITQRVMDDENAEFNALQTGELDFAGVSADRVASLDDGDGLRVVEQAGSEMRHIDLNANEDVFDDERVRQAIAHAIDRQEIVDGSAGGFGRPTCAYANPPGVPWDTDYCPYPYDPDRARELLAEAGAEDLRFEFKHFSTGDWALAAEILTAQLADVGITVELEPRDIPTLIEEVLGESPSFQATILGGSQQIDAWTCPGWVTNDCVEELDELLAEADRSVDADDWADLRQQAVELHADRAYVIPLYNTSLLTVVRDDLAGFKSYRSYAELDLRHLHWEE